MTIEIDENIPDDKAPKTPRSGPTKAQAKKAGEKPSAGRPRGSASRATVKPIEDSLNELLGAAAMLAGATGNIEASVIINSRGPRVAGAWAELARQNPAVRRVIERMMAGGAWGQVVFASLSMAMPVAASYGVLPFPNPFAMTEEEVIKVAEVKEGMEAMFRAMGGDAS